MAIRKDVNDMLNNLKQEPQKEEKHSKSKFDDMSVDDLLTALNDGKENRTERPVKKNAPIRELKRIPPLKPKEQPESENNVSSEKKVNKKSSPKPKNNDESIPKKKKIVISGELPDYEAIRQQEIKEDKKKEKEKPSRPAESEKKENGKNDKDNSSKGLFSRIKDLMYVSAEDDAENKEETDEKPESADTDDKDNFTVEEIKENNDSIIASIEEAISAINDTGLVKDDDSVVKEIKPEESKHENVSDNRKKGNKTKQNSAEKKKSETKTGKTENPKQKKPETKNVKNESLEQKKSETKNVKTESPEQKKSETKTGKTENPEQKKSETKTGKTENPEQKKSETKTEKTRNPEEKKDSAKKPQQSGSKKKKSGNKPVKESQKTVKSSDSIIENIQKDAENAISEIENRKSDRKQQENIDISVEEPVLTEKESKQSPESRQKKNITAALEQILDENPDEIIITRSENTEDDKKSVPVKFKNEKYAVLGMICAVLAVIGIIAIISTCISHIGGGKNTKESFAEAVYPAVIMDINSFENPSELPSDQIISAAIWSVVIDGKKLSKYDERMGVVIIPAVDVESFAVELFGEDIPELNHTTVGPVESKFYYNEEAKSYNVQVKPDTFTYLPEVTSVSKKDGEYIVDVNYIEEHPEWMEKSVAKTVQYKLSKNDDGGYKINSMKIISENPSID